MDDFQKRLNTILIKAKRLGYMLELQTIHTCF
jgi:hypothetical protein